MIISSQKEDIYQGKDFSELEPSEFVSSATRVNVKDFKAKFKMFGKHPIKYTL